ncbi:hypothetical protein V8G54_028592 [Vigna mungo]|uniref:Uncharacterized protein n=1 Tax=Vigna mungo TaxID=3915 RepID=A0AAQ3MSV2_VIGMU
MNSTNGSHFYDEDNRPKFPFYWTDNPFRYKEWLKDIMFNEDKRIDKILDLRKQFADKAKKKGMVNIVLNLMTLWWILISSKALCEFNSKATDYRELTSPDLIMCNGVQHAEVSDVKTGHPTRLTIALVEVGYDRWEKEKVAKEQVAKELTGLKKNYETDQKAWNEDKKALEENEKIMKSWKTRYLDSENVEEGDCHRERSLSKSQCREVSSKDARFHVNKDICEGRMMDVNDVATAKTVGKTTMTEDVIVEDGFDEEATSVFLDITALDDMGNRINELEQSINDLRAEMGVESSPSPVPTAKPSEDETKEGGSA